MPSINSLVKLLSKDYPEFVFKPGKTASWNCENNEISYSNVESAIFIIHELSHALLGHNSYKKDIDLLKMERDAWEKAKQLCDKYAIEIDENLIQESLDTYRKWLFSKSLCTKCKSTGVQVGHNIYKCPYCDTKWIVNEARSHRLRKHEI